MTSTVMMERPMMPGMSMPGTAPGMSATGSPIAPSMMMVPRCTMKFEKCAGGMKMVCTCDDPMACATMQNLCKMMAGGMVGCCMMMNGMMVCSCNLMMGMCKCEMTANGCTISCTSGDAKCCEMIQACCDCMMAMMKAGCTCCMMMNNMPICCGTC